MKPAAPALDPVHATHANVHDDDVDALAVEKRQRCAAVACLADDFEVGLRVKDPLQADAYQFLIVDEQDLQRRA